MILIKQYPSVQLSYLYLLLYCKSVDKFLGSSHPMLHGLDYSFRYTVYYKSGIIKLEIILYTREAKRFSDAIKNLAIDTDINSVGLGIAQITAKIEKMLVSTDIEKVSQALEELHKQPWQAIDDITSIDTKDAQMRTDILAIDESVLQPASEMTMRITLDSNIAESRPELLPLFMSVADLMYGSCGRFIASLLGFYNSETKDVQRDNGFSVPFVFKVPPVRKDILDDRRLFAILDSFIIFTQDCEYNGALDRFVDDLKSTTYSDTPRRMARTGDILKDTGVFIGTKGWEEIATVENCNLLFDNMSVQASYGQKKVSRQVKARLKELNNE